MDQPFAIRRLAVDELTYIARIDRSEHVDVEYTVRGGELVERPVTVTEIPNWYADGDGDFTVAGQVAFCRPIVERGGAAFGAFAGDDIAGVTVVEPRFEPPLAWLAFLHVSRPHRARGAASALWTAAVDLARHEGATRLYVSATPTGSAVGFYLSRGCRLADPVHPVLYAAEPDDVHLVCLLGT